MKRIARIPAALLALVAAAWACPTPAVGDTIVVYTSITSFEAALSSYDEFDEPQSGTLGAGANGFGATASAVGGLFEMDGVNASGNDAGDSPGTDLAGPLNFTSFLNGANAFGGFFYNAGQDVTEVDRGSVRLTFNGGTTETVTTPSSDTVPFMGFIDMTGPLSSVSIAQLAGDFFATADRVIIGVAPAAVPEPTSILMTAGGLALAGLVAYRRRKAARA